MHEQTHTHDLQDQELASLQRGAQVPGFADDPLTGSALRSNVTRGWFDPEMNWNAAPTGRRGRQQTFSDAAIQTCLSMKVLFGMALRQTTGFVESLLRLVGLDWTVPDFSTLSRRQKTLAVNIPYRGSKGPLHLLIDSTGIKVEGEGEWGLRPFRAEMIPRIISRTPFTPQAWWPEAARLAQDPSRD